MKKTRETARMVKPTDSTGRLHFVARTKIRTRGPETKKTMSTRKVAMLAPMGAEAFGAHRAKVAKSILNSRETVKAERIGAALRAGATARANTEAERRRAKAKTDTHGHSRLVGRHTKHADGTVTYHTKSKGKAQTAARIGHSLMWRHKVKKAKRAAAKRK